MSFSTWTRLHSLVVLTSFVMFASAQVQGSLKVFSYNVAGLPELLSSGNPQINTPLISPRLSPYGLIHVQEDFNYHAALYASDNHVYRTPTSGGVPVGSGLNTLTDYPYIDLERVTWKDCNINEADCLTPKGFTFMRVKVQDGVWFDAYNLHADAGSDAGDVSARAKNFQQVQDFMNTWSAGMPVVIMGDTNTRYTRPGDSDTLRKFISGTRVNDTWISSTRGGSYPAENNAFLNASGAPLSDHYPISATLSWYTSILRLGDPSGGPHGTPFNDIPSAGTTIPSASSIPKITSLTIRGGNRVDGVSYTTSAGTTVTRGGSGGTPGTLILAPSERITSVRVCWGKYSDTTRVFFTSVSTSQGRTLEAGETTGDCLVSSVPSDSGGSGAMAWGLVGFWGRGGVEIDRLGAIWGAVY